MLDIAHLLKLSEVYGAALGAEEKTVSYRVFGDSKKLSALRRGSDINVGRFNTALQWFSDNWPDGLVWPTGIARPSVRIPEAAE